MSTEVLAFHIIPKGKNETILLAQGKLSIEWSGDNAMVTGVIGDKRVQIGSLLVGDVPQTLAIVGGGDVQVREFDSLLSKTDLAVIQLARSRKGITVHANEDSKREVQAI